MWKPGTHVGTIKRRVSLLHTCVLMNAMLLVWSRDEDWDSIGMIFWEVFSTAPRAVLLHWTGLGTDDGAESFIGVEVSVWI